MHVVPKPQGLIPGSTRCITHIVAKQRADEGIGPCDFKWLCILIYFSHASSTSTFIVPPQTMPSDSATSPVRSMSMSL